MTPIEWTDETWNPTRGCSVVSPGCVNCYAMKQAHRFSGEGKAYHGLTKQTKAGPQWTGRVVLDEPTLRKPLLWQNPRRVFVNSMSDLFHESLPDAFIDSVFAVMALCPKHTFQVLTKRPERMRAYMSHTKDAAGVICRVNAAARDIPKGSWWRGAHTSWPWRNVWLGVSVENQQYADERIPLLLQTPAAVRFISAEPLLGPLFGLDQWLLGGADNRPIWTAHCPVDEAGFARIPGVDWVIVGGESGAGARPCHLDWIRSIIEQCHAARVPVFCKQFGARPVFHNPVTAEDEPYRLRDRKGGDWSEWPEYFRRREFPQVTA